jgi:prepilin-type N-terminal cleavage/methylation domain-containing protein
MTRIRSGTTLTELMIALVVMGIIGTGMVRLMTSQSRFFNEQEGTAAARRVARSGLNLMFTDLRMVETDSSIVTATPTTLSVKLPYWVGISCGLDAGLSGNHVTMPPIDSMTLAMAGYSGYGYIDTNSIPHLVNGSALQTGSGAFCNTAGIDTVPHARARTVLVKPGTAAMPAGTPVFLWRTVSYSFGASASVTGAIGLFRTVAGNSTSFTEEIAAPFDSAAAFAYYVPGSTAPVSNPAAGTPVLGVDLRLIGLNERNITNGQTQQARFETALYFKNR